MTRKTDPGDDEQCRSETGPSSSVFDRRNYLKLAGTTALAGLGSTVFGSVSAAEGDLARTLTIERGSGSQGDAVHYQFSVTGDIDKSTALGASINSSDEVRGQNVSGKVTGGRDSYSFTGELSAFGTDGDLVLYLNGEELNNTVHLANNSEDSSTNNYKVFVDGEVLKSTALGGGINSGDNISRRTADEGLNTSTRDDRALGGETVIDGIVEGGRDSYLYSGNITRIERDRGFKITVNGERVTRTDFSRDKITFESNGDRGSYAFAVSGDIRKSNAMDATQNSNDIISNGTASGQVINGGRDSYAFTGEITEFSADTTVRVYLNREEVNPGTLVDDGESPDPASLPNLVTLSANTKGRVEYGFSVSGELIPAELANGWVGDNAANGYGRGYLVEGQDSYAFAGEVQSVTDFERIEFQIDRQNQRIDVVDFADNPSNPIEYEFVVSGEVEAAPGTDGSIGYIQNGSVRDEINDGTDKYSFTGDLISLNIDNSLSLETQMAYPRLTSENPHPNASVRELAIEMIESPETDQMLFTTTTIDDSLELYLADGVSSAGDIPKSVLRLTDGSSIGSVDIDWNKNQLQFWNDTGINKQRIELGSVLYVPDRVEDRILPVSVEYGGEL